MQKRHVKHPFPPIVDDKSRILILGSVPSVKSVENNFYYMHPQNRFWRVLSFVVGRDFASVDTAEREKLLRLSHIAMYDSVEECDIEGSSDLAISNVIPADIGAIVKGTEITRIFCNGVASYNLFIKHNPELARIAERLPSTSPANASYSLQKLIDEWSSIKKYL